MQDEKNKTFEDSLRIDQYSLDTAWLAQPMLYYQWSKDYAEAVAIRDKTKQFVELARAELDLEVRKNPDKYGLDKATEAGIGNVILTLPKYQDALKAHQEAVYDVNVLSGAIEAINHKKSALDNLTRLFLSGYWAEAKKAPAEMREKMEKKVQTEQEQGLAQNPRLKKLVRKT